MKKVISKIFVIICLFFVFLIPLANYSSAESLKDIDDKAKGFIEKGRQADASVVQQTDKKMSDIVVPIAQILVAVGTVVVVVAASVMGIKYMIATPEEKAKLKTQLIGLVVATIVIFAAQFIWSTVYNLFIDF